MPLAFTAHLTAAAFETSSRVHLSIHGSLEDTTLGDQERGQERVRWEKEGWRGFRVQDMERDVGGFEKEKKKRGQNKKRASVTENVCERPDHSTEGGYSRNSVGEKSWGSKSVWNSKVRSNPTILLHILV